MEAPRRLGRCRGAFWMALLFDGVGLAILLVGVFVDVYFSDLLIYGGGLGIFFSLLWWVFWYVGNLEVPPAELQDDVGLDGKAKEGEQARESTARSVVGSLSARSSGTVASCPRTSVSTRPRGGSAKRTRTTFAAPAAASPSPSPSSNAVDQRLA